MTYNIKLRRFEYEDAQALADFCNDEDLQRYLLLCRLPYTVDDAHAFIKYAKDCQKSGGEQCFAITLDDNVIGCISYTIQSGCHYNSASVGYYISKEYWHNGIMPIAVKNILEIIFQNSAINRVFAEIFAENTPSARVLEKCGFVREGFLRKGVSKDGIMHDAILYALVR